MTLDWWPVRRCRECRRWTAAYVLRWAIAWDSATIPGRSIVTLELRLTLDGYGSPVPAPPEIYQIGPLCPACTDLLLGRRAHGLAGVELRRLLREMAAR